MEHKQTDNDSKDRIVDLEKALAPTEITVYSKHIDSDDK